MFSVLQFNIKTSISYRSWCCHPKFKKNQYSPLHITMYTANKNNYIYEEIKKNILFLLIY